MEEVASFRMDARTAVLLHKELISSGITKFYVRSASFYEVEIVFLAMTEQQQQYVSRLISTLR